MNERIEKLMVKANLTEVIDDAYQERNDWQPFVEKFVELIVREVFSVIEDERYEIYDPVVHKVKQHFGVEE